MQGTWVGINFDIVQAGYMGVHCIMFIGNMWKLLFGPEDVYIF